MRVTALDETLLPAWEALFEESHSHCYCRYWHFTGNKNEWLERCAFTPERNRDEHAALVQKRDASALGLVALEDGPSGEKAVGWLKLTPREHVSKLRNLPVYRAFSMGKDDDIFSIGCVLVHPDYRNRGVARALVENASAWAATWGATMLEAYPRRAEGRLNAEEAWLGPLSVYEQCGFVAVFDDGPYPVMRKYLR